MKEIWKPTHIYGNRYSVSNFGYIINRKTGRILKPGMYGKGYFFVVLCFNYIQKSTSVSSLVAYAFLGHRQKGYEINHKDGNKSNNCVFNLEYRTHSENMKHAHENGLMPSFQGSNNGRAKLKESEVIEIRNLYFKKNISQPIIAKKFSIDKTTVSNIIVRKTWKHI